MVHLTWGVLGGVAGLCPSPRAIAGLEIVPLVIMDLLLVQEERASCLPGLFRCCWQIAN